MKRSFASLGALSETQKSKRRQVKNREPVVCCFCGRALRYRGMAAVRFTDPRDGVEKSRCLPDWECSGWWYPIVIDDA